MPNPDKTPDAPAAPSASSVNMMQPFLEARIAYFSRLNESWQAAQRNMKDSYCAHVNTSKSLLDEWKQGASDAAIRKDCAPCRRSRPTSGSASPPTP